MRSNPNKTLPNSPPKEDLPGDLNKRLNLSENLFSVIQATIVDGIVLTDLKGIILYINRAGKELLGVKKDVVGVNREILINNQMNFVVGRLEYLYDPIAAFKEVLKGKVLTDLVIKVHGETEKILDTSYSPLYSQDRQVVAVMADFRDITLIMQQQAEIEKQLTISNSRRKRWDALFTNVEEGICITDKDGKILEFNPTLELMTGYLENDVVGKKYYEIFNCHDAKGNFLEDSLLKKAVITQEAVAYDEHLHTTRTGEEIWVGTSWLPLTNEKGEIECLTVVRDISAYKQVEKLKSDFVSIASHELRTPLTVVNGYLALLNSGDLGALTDSSKASQHQTVLKKVYMETKRLSSLVDDLLNISRIEEGRLRVNLEPMNLVALVKNTVLDYQPLAESKKLTLIYVGFERPLKVWGDENKLKQVLTNLIDNAIKYTEKGSIQVDVYEDDGLAITSVTDTGPGIAPNLKEIIFEKFQQAPGSYLKENKGTGLGLFIVKGILELHQGKVWVESRLGEGTTFSFTLPLIKGS